MKKYSIGVDLGGTKILAGIVEKQTGKVVFEVKNKTKKEKGNKKITAKIIETIEELLNSSDIPGEEISSIGLGLAGQVDREKGILINAVNLDCKDLNIKEILEEKFSIPVNIGNDVEVATFGELKFGAGIGYKDIVCIFVGTGVGSSIVKDGKIHFGASQSAGEIGHIIVDLNGRACACGGNGCLEAYASRTAIETRILGAVKKGRKSVITELTDGKSISSKHIKKSLEAHDEVVELIILGGGLIQSVEDFYLQTIKKARAKSLPTPAAKIEFKKAALGDYSGVIGAALLEERVL